MGDRARAQGANGVRPEQSNPKLARPMTGGDMVKAICGVPAAPGALSPNLRM